MADEILSDQELAEITGCAYKSAQASATPRKKLWQI
jgi:hypothetical protein